MNKIFVVTVLLITASARYLNVAEVESLWPVWKVRFLKTYHPAEEGARLAIFTDNVMKIQEYNARNTGVRLGLNQFSDLTSQEFKRSASGCAFVEEDEDFVEANTKTYETEYVPVEVDWRKKGAVTPVKDQGQCGSCWTFSTTGVVEGRYFLNNNKLLSFSEQQIVDCNKQNKGCNGGWPYKAVDYVAKNGIELETDYPYAARDQRCAFKRSKAVANATSGHQFVTPKNKDALKAAIAQQPVSVVIEADEDIFQSYSSGVITSDCGAGIDHAVLAVGYKIVGTQEAYIVKNSWADSWGDQGYVLIGTDETQNDGQGVCGILYQPVVAL